MAHGRDLAAGLLGGARSKAEVESTLREITTRAAANATGDVGVGLSVLADGKVLSIGATSQSAQRMDHGQAKDGDGPCLHALSSGAAVSVTDYTCDSRWPGTAARAADAGVRSSLSLPLKTGDMVLGALNVYSDSPDAFGVEALLSLGAFADQATTSLFLLGELQEQRDDSAYVTAFSRTVQESLRTVLPEVAGLELVGGSVPSAPHAAVGGDWYDALVLPDGSVGLVIGDVMGHGIEAVTTMSQLRPMVRAGAWLGVSPGAVLDMTDELAQMAGITETATLFYGRLIREGSSAQLHYCNAGHLLPLLRMPDGTVTALEGGNRMLLGALNTGAAPSATASPTGVVELPAGSVLLLYTDGLVERASATLEEATAALCHTLAEFDATEPLEQLCQQLLAAPGARDDTTVFTVRTSGTWPSDSQTAPTEPHDERATDVS
jgi:putative methionine-R-sulfoxide reductase with GAF domain